MEGIKIHYSKKLIGQMIAAIGVPTVFIFCAYYYFHSKLDIGYVITMFGSMIAVTLLLNGRNIFKWTRMTIYDEYFEVNSEYKWTVCFRDVQEFYLTKLHGNTLIGIRYKKGHENWRPNDEIEEEGVERLKNQDAPGCPYLIPTRTLDIKPQQLLSLLNKKLIQAMTKQ